MSLPRVMNDYSVQCPRCGLGLAFEAVEGETVACESCGQRLEIVGGRATWDPTAATRRRHVVECPRCETTLVFNAADEDEVECRTCGMPLEVYHGRVVFDPRHVPDDGARGRALASKSPRADRDRAEVRRRHAEALERAQ